MLQLLILQDLTALGKRTEYAPSAPYPHPGPVSLSWEIPPEGSIHPLIPARSLSEPFLALHSREPLRLKVADQAHTEDRHAARNLQVTAHLIELGSEKLRPVEQIHESVSRDQIRRLYRRLVPVGVESPHAEAGRLCPCVENRPNFGFVANANDCDDSNASINPNAAEVCGGGDNNCDGEVDEGCWVKILLHCDANSPTLQTFSGPGPHQYPGDILDVTRFNASYAILGPNVSALTITPCTALPPITVNSDTSFCSLPGGCCAAVRYNDELCQLDLQ